MSSKTLPWSSASNSGRIPERRWRLSAFWPLLLSCPDAIRPSKIGKSGFRADSRAREDDEILGFEHPVVVITVVNAGEGRLRIISPLDKAQVAARPVIVGTVADPNMKVWVVIHPMEASDYWVQPSLTVKNDGTWKVMIYVGRPGRIDVGKQFEVMAVANPKVNLKEGDVLSGWPEAEWKSEVIELIRK